ELAASHLQPGQSVDLTAVLDTNDLSGDEVKMLIVTSNDPGTDGDYKITLSFTGTIVDRQPYQESVGDLFYDSYVLLDVRDPAAYTAGHLVGALNVPATQVGALAAALPPSALTVIYDQDGASSTLSEVTQSLHGAGVAAVYALVGGLNQWQKSYGSARMASAADGSWGPFVEVSGTRSYSSSDVVQKYYVGQLRTDYVLIDMRSPSAFAAGHLAGAVNLAEAELGAYIDVLPRETPIGCRAAARRACSEDSPCGRTCTGASSSSRQPASCAVRALPSDHGWEFESISAEGSGRDNSERTSRPGI
ncbi:MAG: rhodanese-like domain-containing protein, partial [Candidatus Bipolaricaulota bacterium]|nr:rhodanese-like domain-containing protein [Candidatus Bipolaricaulota bacterium]